MTETDDRKLTASSPLHQLDALTTGNIKIHGFKPCKDDINMLLKHVDITPIGCTHKMQKNDKSESYRSFQ